MVEQPRYVLGAYAEQLVLPKQMDGFDEPGVNNPYVLQLRGYGRQGFALQRRFGEQTVERFPPGGVARQTDEQLLPVCVPEVNTQYRVDAGAPAGADKLQSAGSIVDIGQGKGADVPLRRFFRQLPGGKRAVAQAEIGMAVEEHGGNGLFLALDSLCGPMLEGKAMFFIKSKQIVI